MNLPSNIDKSSLNYYYDNEEEENDDDDDNDDSNNRVPRLLVFNNLGKWLCKRFDKYHVWLTNIPDRDCSHITSAGRGGPLFLRGPGVGVRKFLRVLKMWKEGS